MGDEFEEMGTASMTVSFSSSLLFQQHNVSFSL